MHDAIGYQALGGERHRHGETIHSHPHSGPRMILRITAPEAAGIDICTDMQRYEGSQALLARSA
jgi:hypothetical protein